MTYSTLRLCSGRGAFEAVPRPRLSLDLSSVKVRLEAAGFQVTDARVLLIARKDLEVTLSRDGRVLIKSADADQAAAAFAGFRAAAGLPDDPVAVESSAT